MKPEEKALQKFLELRDTRPFETHEDRLAIMRDVVQEAVAEGEKNAGTALEAERLAQAGWREERNKVAEAENQRDYNRKLYEETRKKVTDGEKREQELLQHLVPVLSRLESPECYYNSIEKDLRWVWKYVESRKA